ncbi:hypothetical protein THAOC_16964 [Thalassiosira oceanica]|uniref:Uncharacterized protein n=1 Tax=Thalassiosira oceanica TaxID=159749 RepID=K0S8E1_THAOC|nr:hypothetical protein THAOC_16964 [Thalassiosira oceanica]|eukprot:EJK62428.1 hypothetical protein THAOC_16964 [Thalassiosira oceanica]
MIIADVGSADALKAFGFLLKKLNQAPVDFADLATERGPATGRGRNSSAVLPSGSTSISRGSAAALSPERTEKSWRSKKYATVGPSPGEFDGGTTPAGSRGDDSLAIVLPYCSQGRVRVCGDCACGDTLGERANLILISSHLTAARKIRQAQSASIGKIAVEYSWDELAACIFRSLWRYPDYL